MRLRGFPRHRVARASCARRARRASGVKRVVVRAANGGNGSVRFGQLGHVTVVGSPFPGAVRLAHDLEPERLLERYAHL
jgi:hypothetical protein